MELCEHKYNAGTQSSQAVAFIEGMMSSPKRISDASLIYSGNLILLVLAAVLRNARSLHWFSTAPSVLLLLCVPHYKWHFPPEDEFCPHWASNWSGRETGARTRPETSAKLYLGSDDHVIREAQRSECKKRPFQNSHANFLLLPKVKQTKWMLQEVIYIRLFTLVCFKADGQLYIPLWKACKLQWHGS